MSLEGISKSTLERLPAYLHHLKALPNGAPEHISATALAAALGLGEVQVRKDLGSVSGAGKPKIGYPVESLIHDLEAVLGYNHLRRAIIVGAGKLGRALYSYSGFADYGIRVVAAFDNNSDAIAAEAEQPVYPMRELARICKEQKVQIGIITVPSAFAQEVCDTLVQNGVKAIWNFAPAYLKVPPDVLVRNENMAVSLAILSGHLNEERGYQYE